MGKDENTCVCVSHTLLISGSISHFVPHCILFFFPLGDLVSVHWLSFNTEPSALTGEQQVSAAEGHLP